MGIVSFVDKQSHEIDVPISRFLFSAIVDNAIRIGRRPEVWNQLLSEFESGWQTLLVNELPKSLQQEFHDGLVVILYSIPSDIQYCGYPTENVKLLLRELIGNTKQHVLI
jgi:hypothetical protein